MIEYEKVWEAQEHAYDEMMKEDDQYCHPESFRWGFEQGVDWTEKQLITFIESRISEIVGDAQPNPTLRAELRDLINKLK